MCEYICWPTSQPFSSGWRSLDGGSLRLHAGCGRRVIVRESRYTLTLSHNALVILMLCDGSFLLCIHTYSMFYHYPHLISSLPWIFQSDSWPQLRPYSESLTDSRSIHNSEHMDWVRGIGLEMRLKTVIDRQAEQNDGRKTRKMTPQSIHRINRTINLKADWQQAAVNVWFRGPTNTVPFPLYSLHVCKLWIRARTPKT